jgi:hypothetical protein
MTEPTHFTPQRDALLLSHANPEDNEFTLCLRCSWRMRGTEFGAISRSCWGGEVFWDDMEELIKTRAVKVLRSLKDIECQGRPAQGATFRAGRSQERKTEELRHPAAH